MNVNILKEIEDSGYSLEMLTEKFPALSMMKGVLQNPAYHAEGDVYRHAQLACESLKQSSEWQCLTPKQRQLLFLATAFHDIGKVRSTRWQDGNWISPRHTLIGENEFRALAYRQANQFGLTWKQRETVAKLIRYHGLPVWFFTKNQPDFALIKAAESVSLKLLYLLSKADVKGRVCDQSQTLAEHVQLFADYAKEQNVFEQPYPFANVFTRFSYFQKEDLWQGGSLYDNTQFDVIIMSGLPLSGKDSWIKKHKADWPVISLDDIREEMGIRPTKSSDKVVRLALERARVFLREKTPFIWNATNIREETRQKLVRLFAGYGARARIQYLEAPYQELLDRNKKRARYIPEPVLQDMIEKLEIPQAWEGYQVTWLVDDDAGNVEENFLL